MRLLNTRTGELRWFNHGDIPAYAILSHVWGPNEQTYQDVEKISQALRSHFRSEVKPFLSVLSDKLQGACKCAASLGFEWIWVDTCCIDKASSAELSEAINSMFEWYSKAKKCIAYLEDVPDSSLDLPADESAFRASKWFSRGWTLQELIAPEDIVFVSQGWVALGTKASLAGTIEVITGVNKDVLLSPNALSDVCIAERMSWAANRRTTRIEDEAYSLLGIFGVYMPTLYGEGRHAFRRLQQELLMASPDQTLFAWGLRSAGFHTQQPLGLFAQDPSHFRANSQGTNTIQLEDLPTAVEAFQLAIHEASEARSGMTAKPPAEHNESLPFPTTPPVRIPQDTPTYSVTNYGIRARLPLIRRSSNGVYAIAVLAVKYGTFYVGLVLHSISHAGIGHYTVDELFTHNYRLVLVGEGGSAARIFPSGWMEELYLACGDVITRWEDIFISTAAADVRHNAVASRYLALMNHALRRDICDIRDPSLENHGVPNLPDRIAARIPEELQYACKRWLSHLCLSPSPDSRLLAQLATFVNDHVLHWLAVLSLMNSLRIAMVGLPAALRRLSSDAPHSNTRQLKAILHDIYRALQANYDLISTSALQIYHSALVFMPDCVLRQGATRVAPPPVKLLSARRSDWSPVLKELRGHRSPIESVAFLSDGVRVVTGSRDGTLRIWNTLTQECVATLTGPHTEALAVACSADGKLIASAGEPAGVALWDVEAAALLQVLPGQDAPHTSLAFSPDGSLVAAGAADRTVYLWTVSTGEAFWTMTGRTDWVRSVAFSPDGGRVASGSDDGSVRIWDVRTGQLVFDLDGHADCVRSIAFSPDGGRVVSGGDDRKISVWDAETGESIRFIEGHSDWVISVMVAPDSEHFFSCSDDRTICRWDTLTGECLGSMDTHASTLCAALSPDGTRIATGTEEGVVAILDATACEGSTNTSIALAKPAAAVSMAPDGDCFALPSWDRAVRVWRTRDGAHMQTIAHDAEVNVVLFSPDGTVLASGSEDRFVRLFDTVEWDRFARLSWPGAEEGDWVSGLAFSADGARIACVSERSSAVSVWSVATQDHIATFAVGRNPSVLAFSPDMARIATGGYVDGGTDIWDVVSGERLAKVEMPAARTHSLTFTPDGRRIVSRMADGSVFVGMVPQPAQSPMAVSQGGGGVDVEPVRFSWQRDFYGEESLGWLQFNGQEPKRVCWFPVERRPASIGGKWSFAWHGDVVVVVSRWGMITVVDVSEAIQSPFSPAPFAR